MKQVLFAMLALSAAPALAADNSAWSLVWSDEFDGGKIDRAKWGYDVDCWGGGNEEHQCYTKSARNAAIEDGKLVITARYERVTGPALPEHLRRTSATPEAEATRDISSARLSTRGKAAWRYGKAKKNSASAMQGGSPGQAAAGAGDLASDLDAAREGSLRQLGSVWRDRHP